MKKHPVALKHPIPKFRAWDGKRYEFYQQLSSKSEADHWAKMVRKRGFFVRVVERDRDYLIYSRIRPATMKKLKKIWGGRKQQ